jgi:ribonucleoside-diphosphate reductase alpha chain
MGVTDSTDLIAADGSITDPYRNFISVSRYARWIDELNRRETWQETVDRYVGFFIKHLVTNYGYEPDDSIFTQVRTAILNHEVMPSMRAMMTAGPALERSHISGYNCAFIAVNDPRAFDEAMYILLNGTGVGFSVERRHVEQLPRLPETLQWVDKTIVVEDSKEGWVEAFRDLLTMLWQGDIPTWDLSLIRPAGARLKTFGGRASGPCPLDQLFAFAVDTFTEAAGRRLNTVEAHDLMCKVGDVVVSGGVRRSALISLSDLSDDAMAKAKSGPWWKTTGHRRLANNSAVYTEKPSITQFAKEWANLIESQSGERGIYNLAGARAHAAAQGRTGTIEGTNPCGEILLRDMEFCNLTEVVIREDDTTGSLSRKVRLAAIMGTWQSTLTNFTHLRDEWRQNCEEERLLGVSLTGIYGNARFNNPEDPGLPERLAALRKVAHVSNAAEARRLGIPASAAITCVKPSGTVSQLTGVSSGIHPWHSRHYIRTVRAANTDPLTRMLKDYEVPHEPDLMDLDNSTVFSFPIKAPASAVTRDQVSAREHLQLWSIYRENWTDHNPSITVNVRDSEWMEVGAWVLENWDRVGGVAFLPHSGHTYQQAPYTECDALRFRATEWAMPKIHWGDLVFYESEDTTTGTQELACSAGGCEVVDLVAAPVVFAA